MNKTGNGMFISVYLNYSGIIFVALKVDMKLDDRQGNPTIRGAVGRADSSVQALQKKVDKDPVEMRTMKNVLFIPYPLSSGAGTTTFPGAGRSRFRR